MEALFIGVSFCPGYTVRGTWRPGKPPAMRPCRQQGSCRTRSIKVWTEGRPAARACGQVVSFRYCSEALSGPWRHGGTNGAHARIVTCRSEERRVGEEWVRKC